MAADPNQTKPMEPVTSTGNRPSSIKSATRALPGSPQRVTMSKGGSSVAKGDFGPRTSAPIVNGR